MKLKMALAAALLAVGTAQAVEVGLTGTRDYSGNPDRTGYGVTVGQKMGAVGITAGFERFTHGDRQDRYSLVAGYDVAKFGPVTVTPKVGVAYLNNTTAVDGYAMTVGVGASVPVTKQVSVGLDYARQYGQDRVSQFDGNRVTAAVKYAF